MIRVTTFAGKQVAVFGLGGSGLASARALLAGGADVAAWDDGEAGKAAAVADGIPLVDLRGADWSRFAALVLAPGVPLTHPEPHWTVQAATAAGVEVIGDVELFCRERRTQLFEVPFVAITGTNGKSTTTALSAHLLRGLGLDTEVGGNIGTAILALEPPTPGRHYVIEMSSFQIELTPTLDPAVGVLLNVTPDHLDRHGTMDRYAAIKERLVVASRAAAIGVDDAWTAAVAERLPNATSLHPFSAGRGSAFVPSLYAMGQTLFAHESDGAHARSREVANLAGISTLRGRHNVQNTLAALTALRALGGSAWQPDAFQRLLESFPGLPHRMEQVGAAGQVIFINDSKATNADSTEKALLSWERDIFWIAGGLAKDGGIAALAPLLGRVTKAYLIGEAANEFARTLSTAGVPYELSGTLDAATTGAARDAAQSRGSAPVVLLSPACASYDQFRNFEVRGDAFRRLVAAEIGREHETVP